LGRQTGLPVVAGGSSERIRVRDPPVVAEGCTVATDDGELVDERQHAHLKQYQHVHDRLSADDGQLVDARQHMNLAKQQDLHDRPPRPR